MFSALSAQDIVFGVLVLGFVGGIVLPNITHGRSKKSEHKSTETEK